MAAIDLNEAKQSTIIAALRIYQRELNLNGGAVPTDVADIATSCDKHDPLNDAEIDNLCDEIKCLAS